MTKLRERMIGDMQLRGLADRTIEAYVHAVRGLALHFKTPPDELTDEDQTASTPATTGAADDPVAEERPLWRCPYCHRGALRWIRAIHRQRGPP